MASDQPVERELRLTRGLIEVLHEANHPFGLVTKSSGVERDLDLIVPMAQKGLAAVYVTITTLDAELARKLEPRAAAPTPGTPPSSCERASWPAT